MQQKGKWARAYRNSRQNKNTKKKNSRSNKVVINHKHRMIILPKCYLDKNQTSYFASIQDN